MMTVAYFCKATEIRFISDETDKNNLDNIQNNINSETNITNLSADSTSKESFIESDSIFDQGEYYHSLALKTSCEFLPSTSPIVKHYISSYSKHFGYNMKELVNNLKLKFFFYFAMIKINFLFILKKNNQI